MKNRKKIGITIAFAICLFGLSTYVNAAGESDLNVDGFSIMPELDNTEKKNINDKIVEIGQTGGGVRDKYNETASKLETSEQIASGIMNRDTIMNYLVFIVKFLSQLGIAVGVIFIMYAGYKYMISVFSGGKTPSSTVKNAIIGVIIVIFSYAIMKTLTSLIGLS